MKRRELPSPRIRCRFCPEPPVGVCDWCNCWLCGDCARHVVGPPAASVCPQCLFIGESRLVSSPRPDGRGRRWRKLALPHDGRRPSSSLCVEGRSVRRGCLEDHAWTCCDEDASDRAAREPCVVQLHLLLGSPPVVPDGGRHCGHSVRGGCPDSGDFSAAPRRRPTGAAESTALPRPGRRGRGSTYSSRGGRRRGRARARVTRGLGRRVGMRCPTSGPGAAFAKPRGRHGGSAELGGARGFAPSGERVAVGVAVDGGRVQEEEKFRARSAPQKLQLVDHIGPFGGSKVPVQEPCGREPRGVQLEPATWSERLRLNPRRGLWSFTARHPGGLAAHLVGQIRARTHGPARGQKELYRAGLGCLSL